MISKDDVRHVAGLARIHMEEVQLESLTKDLEAILSYVEKLNACDVTDVSPTSHVLHLENVWREDVIKPSLSQEQATGFAVEQDNGAFKVPKVIE